MMTRLHAILSSLSIRPLRTAQALLRLPAFVRDRHRYQVMAENDPEWPIAGCLPCLLDRQAEGGSASGHYFHQDLRVARRVFEKKPRVHYDVGSRVDGFVAHVAAFRPIIYFDIRPLRECVHNIEFRFGDLMKSTTMPIAGCDSLSCLHVIEHVGLGRYGDALNPDGWAIALGTLAGMLEYGGVLYLSVPVGAQRIAFNAHRVFRPSTILDRAHRLGLRLEDFAWVDDSGALHEQTLDHAPCVGAADGLIYGCGIFEFRRVVHASPRAYYSSSNLL